MSTAQNGNHTMLDDTNAASKINHYHSEYDISLLDSDHPDLNTPVTDLISDYGEKLLAQQLIFISGTLANKKRAARLIAASLKDQLFGIEIFELTSIQANNQKICHLLAKQYTRGIFIFQEVKASAIGFCYESLKKMAGKNLFLFIVVTDEPQNAWHLPASLTTHWYELTDNELPLPPPLIVASLASSPTSKLKETTSMTDSNSKDYTGTGTLADPETASLDVETRVAEAEPAPVASPTVAQPSPASITQWFEQLTERQRALAIGLTTFHGMSVEQTLALLDIAVEDSWRSRQDYLAKFDIADIRQLAPYFRPNSEYIESSDNQLLEALFDHCWQYHRRYITSLLPMLSELVMESFSQNPEHREILGTLKKREKFRTATADLLARIIEKDVALAEEYFAYWITTDLLGPFETIGRAFANYYQEHQSAAETYLTAWLDDKQASNLKTLLMDDLELTGKNPDKDKRNQIASEKLKVFSAFSIGYITEQYPPSELPESIVKTFKGLIKHGTKNQQLNAYLNRPILQKVFANHFTQFADSVEECITRYRLSECMPKVLAAAHGNYADAVWALLEKWIADLEQYRELKDQDEKDKLQQLALMGLKTIHELGTKNLERTITLLDKIVTNYWIREYNPEIRGEALKVSMNLIGKGVGSLDERIETLLSSVTVEERASFIKNITDTYIKQRKQLGGGDAQLEIDGEKYWVWLADDKQRSRPLLAIEQTLNNWLDKAKTPEAVQLAYLAESNIVSAFEDKEQKAIKEYKKAQKDKESTQHDNTQSEIEKDLPSFGLPWFSKWFIMPIIKQLPSDKEHKDKLQAILSSFLQQDNDIQQGMIKRYMIDGKHDIANIMKRVLLFETYKTEMLFLVVAVILLVVEFFVLS